MTISVAWIRKINECEELWIASDSRLSGNGTTWDECMKLNILPGERSFIAFAGSTNIAYPIMNQVSNTVKTHRKSMLGYLDIKFQKGHILNVVNSTIKSIKFDNELIKEIDLNNTEFIFGGYSWHDKEFKLWNFFYDKQIKRFVEKFAYDIKNFGKCVIAGDVKNKGIWFLHELIRNKYGKNINQIDDFKGFDMEPLEMIRDLLRRNESNYGTPEYLKSIGGPVQMIKVYQHSNAEAIGVYWPDKEKGKPTILGRFLQGYENTDAIYMDPDTFIAKRIKSPNFWDD